MPSGDSLTRPSNDTLNSALRRGPREISGVNLMLKGQTRSPSEKVRPFSSSRVPGAVVEVSAVNVGRCGVAWKGPLAVCAAREWVSSMAAAALSSSLRARFFAGFKESPVVSDWSEQRRRETGE